jgi:hypothetical protein
MAMVATATQRSKFPKATLGSKRICAPKGAAVKPRYPTLRPEPSRRFPTMCNSYQANYETMSQSAALISTIAAASK